MFRDDVVSPQLFLVLLLLFACCELASSSSPSSASFVHYFTARAHRNPSDKDVYRRKTLYQKIPNRPWSTLRGHLYTVHNPEATLSIVPPHGGCSSIATLEATAAGYAQDAPQRTCLVATNAAFFDTNASHPDRCIGGLVSDGAWSHAMPNGTHATFGIDDSGEIVVGYLNRTDVSRRRWRQLVQGSFWLVQDGLNYVGLALDREDLTFQSGAARWFANLKAPRSAIGVDRRGRVMLLVVDGNENSWDGTTLYELADVLIAHGAVHAINLDGGGSSAILERGVVVNYPSDVCDGVTTEDERCDRQVSAITCVHVPQFTGTATPSRTVTQTEDVFDDKGGTPTPSPPVPKTSLPITGSPRPSPPTMPSTMPTTMPTTPSPTPAATRIDTTPPTTVAPTIPTSTDASPSQPPPKATHGNAPESSNERGRSSSVSVVFVIIAIGVAVLGIGGFMCLRQEQRRRQRATGYLPSIGEGSWERVPVTFGSGQGPVDVEMF
eukprot:PhM_4_TR6999/c0_g1_i1/m.43242/K01125/NAGPA; N-acetylglucosamine-1-phosphodiester alpha-N-acetylglucosaminidase